MTMEEKGISYNKNLLDDFVASCSNAVVQACTADAPVRACPCLATRLLCQLYMPASLLNARSSAPVFAKSLHIVAVSGTAACSNPLYQCCSGIYYC